MKNLKARLIVALLVVWVCVIVFSFQDGAGVFFSQMSNGTFNYNVMESSQMKKNMPVSGNVYLVVDILASSVTEETSDSGHKTETTNAYYYIIPFDDTHCMLLKTAANSDLTNQADMAVDEFWSDDDSYETNPNSIYNTGINIDGILVNNDPEIVAFYDEYAECYELTDMTLVPYTMDCTMTVASRIRMFWIGTVLTVVLVLVLVIIITKFFSSKRSNRGNAAFAGGVSNPYVPQSNIPQSNAYDPTQTYSSSYNNQQTGFQPQGVQQNNGYGASDNSTYGGYQSQGVQQNNSYGASDNSAYGGYQSQGVQQNNGYGASDNSTYGGYQSQQNNGYGASDNSAYGGYQSQSNSSNYDMYNNQ